MIKKCKRCNKLLFFRFKLYLGNYYCAKCVAIVQARDIEEEKKEPVEEKEEPELEYAKSEEKKKPKKKAKKKK